MWNCCCFCAIRIMCHLGGKLRLSDSVQINLNCLQKSDQIKGRLDCAVVSLFWLLCFWLTLKAFHLKTYANNERMPDFILLSCKQIKIHLSHLGHCPCHSKFCFSCTYQAISWYRWVRLHTSDFKTSICTTALLEIGRSFRDKAFMCKNIHVWGY